MRHRRLAAAALVTVAATLGGCSSSGSSAPRTTTTGGGGGNAGGAGGAAGGGGSGGSSASSNPSTSIATTSTVPETTTTEAAPSGTYGVRQTQTLGGETISGTVCDIARSFTVHASTSKVAWTFAFVPSHAAARAGTVTGTFSYAYQVPGAGESHIGSGTYRISAAAAKGTRTVSLAGRDRVVFHGFNGPIPVRYSFALVPSATC